MPAKKKIEPSQQMGPRILVVLEPGSDGARAVEVACRLGRETHAGIHLLASGVGSAAETRSTERATQQARLFHMRVVAEPALSPASSGGLLRAIRRVRPDTLVLATSRPAAGWAGLRAQARLWTLLRKAGCEVVVVKS